MVVLQQFDERCAYLATDGACRLHRDNGFEAKPPVCKLFPASAVSLWPDATLIVAPDFTCPLELGEPLSVDSVPLDHAALRPLLEAEGHRLGATTISLPNGTPSDALDLERECRDAEPFSADADYIDYAARQLVRAAYRASGIAGRPVARQDVANARADLLVHLAEVTRLLGSRPPPALPERSTRCMIAMTGTLRLRLLHMFSEEPYWRAVERIPFVLCVIAWYAAHHVASMRLRGATSYELSPGALDRLWRSMVGRALLLGDLFSVPYLEAVPELPNPVAHREAVMALARSFAADEEARRAFLQFRLPDPSPSARTLKAHLELAVPDATIRGEVLDALSQSIRVRFHAT